MQFLKDNFPFFAGLFGVLGGWLLVMGFVSNEDIILSFSQTHNPSTDQFFQYATKLGEPIAYLAAGAVLVFIGYRYVAAVGFVALMAMVVSFLMKGFFQAPRPAGVFMASNRMHELNLVAGEPLLTYSSFPSGHTISAFALFGFLAFISANKHLKMVFLSLAIFVGLSRVYLLHHFLRDVYAGAAIGTLIAMLAYYVCTQINYSWANKSLVRS